MACRKGRKARSTRSTAPNVRVSEQNRPALALSRLEKYVDAMNACAEDKRYLRRQLSILSRFVRK